MPIQTVLAEGGAVSCTDPSLREPAAFGLHFVLDHGQGLLARPRIAGLTWSRDPAVTIELGAASAKETYRLPEGCCSASQQEECSGTGGNTRVSTRYPGEICLSRTNSSVIG